MIPCKLTNATHVFRKPLGWDEATHGPCLDLDVMKVGDVYISAWKPNERELEMLNKGEPVYVQIIGGQPALAVSVGEQKPEPEDRGYDAELHGWAVERYGDPTTGEVVQVLTGTVQDDRKKRFKNGEFVRTSRVVKIDEKGFYHTRNSIYKMVGLGTAFE